jgi:propionyl-CoA synthetase
MSAAERYQAVYRRSIDDPDAFWLEAAARLAWTSPPTRAFEQPDPPSFRWFADGRLNLAVNALDRHVKDGRGDVVALVALDEAGGRRSLTYAQLLADVERVAAGLRGLGVGFGDRVTI